MKNAKPKLWKMGFILITIIAFISCETGKKLSQLNKNADTAYRSGDMQTALNNYEKIITFYENKNNVKNCPVYTKAGQAAFALDKNDKALNYFNKALYTVSENADTYFELAKLYRKIDNLSKEINALQTYVEKYPNGKDLSQVKKRLFETYVKSENWDKALNFWPKLGNESANGNELLTGFFQVNKALNHTKICDSLAKILLARNKNNIMALEWKAKKYYYLAEKSYQSEIKVYETHKTRRQYAKLLKAFDVVTANFKYSLYYFKKLYLIKPNKEYARYIANIYIRLDDKKKADYYLKKTRG